MRLYLCCHAFLDGSFLSRSRRPTTAKSSGLCAAARSLQWGEWDKSFASWAAAGTPVFEVLVLSATNLRKGDWFGKNDVYVEMYLVSPNVMREDYSKGLPNPNDKRVLEPGELAFHFSIQLATYLPSSHVGKDGDKVKYICEWLLTAEVDAKRQCEVGTRQALTVVAPIPAGLPYFLNMPEWGLSTPVSCCLFNKGSFQSFFLLDRMAFAVGESPTVVGAIINETRGEVSLEISLRIHHVVFTDVATKLKGALWTRKWRVAPRSSLLFPAEKLPPVPDTPPSYYGRCPVQWSLFMQRIQSDSDEPLRFYYSLRICVSSGKCEIQTKKLPFVVAGVPLVFDKTPCFPLGRRLDLVCPKTMKRTCEREFGDIPVDAKDNAAFKFDFRASPHDQCQKVAPMHDFSGTRASSGDKDGEEDTVVVEGRAVAARLQSRSTLNAREAMEFAHATTGLQSYSSRRKAKGRKERRGRSMREKDNNSGDEEESSGEGKEDGVMKKGRRRVAVRVSHREDGSLDGEQRQTSWSREKPVDPTIIDAAVALFDPKRFLSSRAPLQWRLSKSESDKNYDVLWLVPRELKKHGGFQQLRFTIRYPDWKLPRPQFQMNSVTYWRWALATEALQTGIAVEELERGMPNAILKRASAALGSEATGSNTAGVFLPWNEIKRAETKSALRSTQSGRHLEPLWPRRKGSATSMSRVGRLNAAVSSVGRRHDPLGLCASFKGGLTQAFSGVGGSSPGAGSKALMDASRMPMPQGLIRIQRPLVVSSAAIFGSEVGSAAAGSGAFGWGRREGDGSRANYGNGTHEHDPNIDATAPFHHPHYHHHLERGTPPLTAITEIDGGKGGPVLDEGGEEGREEGWSGANARGGGSRRELKVPIYAVGDVENGGASSSSQRDRSGSFRGAATDDETLGRNGITTGEAHRLANHDSHRVSSTTGNRMLQAPPASALGGQRVTTVSATSFLLGVDEAQTRLEDSQGELPESGMRARVAGRHSGHCGDGAAHRGEGGDDLCDYDDDNDPHGGGDDGRQEGGGVPRQWMGDNGAAGRGSEEGGSESDDDDGAREAGRDDPSSISTAQKKRSAFLGLRTLTRSATESHSEQAPRHERIRSILTFNSLSSKRNVSVKGALAAESQEEEEEEDEEEEGEDEEEEGEDEEEGGE